MDATLLEKQHKLVKIANNEHATILDRVDAFLELSLLYQHNTYTSATYINEARKLITTEYRKISQQ